MDSLSFGVLETGAATEGRTSHAFIFVPTIDPKRKETKVCFQGSAPILLYTPGEKIVFQVDLI